MATGYLEHTLSAPDTNGNKKATFSAWLKRAKSGVEHVFYTVRQNSTNFFRFRFDSDKINVTSQVSGTNYYATTNALFRDPSAFYHVVVTYDTTQSTASNRIKIYVNGTEQSLSASNYPSQDATLFMIASGQPQRVGQESGSGYFDGVMAHVHYTEGYAYAASDFGETDSTSGIWKPKTSPSGINYGTNGFFLKFENSGAMGTDSSGNSNTFTVNNSVIQNVDTPSNNFATLSPLTRQASLLTLTNGNTTLTTPSSTEFNTATSTLAMSSGKYYFEVKRIAERGLVGITNVETAKLNTTSQYYNGDTDNSNDYGYYSDDGKVYNNGNPTGSGATWGNGDIVGCAVDLDNRKIYWHKNGTYINSGNPSAGSGGQAIPADLTYYFAVSGYTSTTFQCNFGNGFFGTTAVSSAGSNASNIGIFEYDVPTGYTALSTKGLNE